MKKGLTILMLAVMLLSCENEISYEAYPEMGEFYTESCGLKAVSTDSVKNFAVKVDNFVVKNPEAKQHSLYPKIVENIKASSLNFGSTGLYSSFIGQFLNMSDVSQFLFIFHLEIS